MVRLNSREPLCGVFKLRFEFETFRDTQLITMAQLKALASL